MVMIWMDGWSALVVEMVLLMAANVLSCNENGFVRSVNEVASGDARKKVVKRT
jgi:hypothetical protein